MIDKTNPAKNKQPGTFKEGNRVGIGNRGYTKSRRSQKRIISAALEMELQKRIRLGDHKSALTLGQHIAKRLGRIAAFGEDKHAVRAIAEIMDRIEGKATQRIEHAGDPDQPVQMITREMSPSEASRIFTGMLRREKK
jgi:hypothetical protein